MSAIAIGLLLVFSVAAYLVVAPIVAFVRAGDALRRLRDLEGRLDTLSRRVAELGRALPEPPPPGTSDATPVPSPPTEAPRLPPPAAGSPEAAAKPAPLRAKAASSFETRVGERWLLYAGVTALFLAAAYFIKFAFENDWVTPAMRVMVGAASGLALVGLGRRFAARGFARYGQTLAGVGVAILYLSAYAAFNFYALVGGGVAFGLMVAITVLAAFVADSEQSQGLALVAVVGGFATPFLVATGRNAEVALFSYVALLVAGTMALARRRQWPALDATSYVLTVATIASWAAGFYRPSAWAATFAFLTLFCAMFVYILRQTLRIGSTEGRLVSALLATGPLLYHISSLALLWTHPLVLLVYLIVVATAGAMLLGSPDQAMLRLLAWTLVAGPALGWAGRHPVATWLVPGVAAIVGIYAVHLVAHLRGVRDEHQPPRLPELVLLHANGLWVYGALYVLLTNHALRWLGLVALVAAAWNGLVARSLALRSSEGALHCVALAFALAAVGVAVEFNGAWVTVGWAAEGFALAWIGVKAGRPWVRVAGYALLGVAVWRVVEQLVGPPPVPWMALVNARALVAAFAVVLLCALAWVTTGPRTLATGRLSDHAVLIVGANALTLMLLSAEIDAAYGMRAWTESLARGVGAVTAADFGRQTSLSVLWAAYALALVAIGFWSRSQTLRSLGIVLFGLTVVKVLLVDLDRLDRLYRILSVFALGVLLLAAAYLYQRFAALIDEPEPRHQVADDP